MIQQSHAAKHRQDVEAGRVASSLPKRQHPANHHRLMLVKLSVDKYELSVIRSRLSRADKKREVLANYADYLSGVINGGSSAHNEVLVTVCLWALDAGKPDYFMTLAAYALLHGMDAPQGFKRRLPELLCEEFSEYVLKNPQPSICIGRLRHLETLINQGTITDAVSAKFYRAQGVALEPSDPQAALQAYAQAQQYGASVKTIMNKLEKTLCNQKQPING